LKKASPKVVRRSYSGHLISVADPEVQRGSGAGFRASGSKKKKEDDLWTFGTRGAEVMQGYAEI
jgi:hypothetical protein